MESPQAGNRYIGIDEAAALLGKHHSTLRRWNKAGILPAERDPGGRLLYWLPAVRAFIKRWPL